jgi:transcription antitermination factor NusG
MGMAEIKITKAEPKESALLKCSTCGNAKRVWLDICKACANPESNWYEDAIAKLEKDNKAQNNQIRIQIDQLNSYAGKVRRLEKNNKRLFVLLDIVTQSLEVAAKVGANAGYTAKRLLSIIKSNVDMWKEEKQ